MDEKSKRLKYISPREVKPNPENPRLLFRQEEMDSLLVSISKYGIQVPVNVYEHRGSFYLIDGERRWRCARKLNLEKIPALVLPKPSELENLLLMSNIHALREQWDYFTIAQNLKRIILLIVKETGFKPNEAQLSAETGLSRGQIRRCQLLIDLPPKYAEMLLKELALPKSQQRITEDFFIEMEKALKTVRRRLPAFEGDMDQIRDTLVAKFRGELIENVLDFRQLSKIATAVQNIGIRKSQAESALQRLFSPHESVGIRDVYEQAVGFGYDERKASQQVAKLNDFFEWILEEDRADRLDEEFLAMVRALYERVRRLLGE